MKIRQTFFSSFISLAAVLSTGCPSISATNPFDPGTPAAQQAPAMLSGLIGTPGLADGSGVIVRLMRGQESVYQTTSRASGIELGAFTFDTVEPGTYRLVVDTRDNPQFLTFDQPLFIALVAGERRDDIVIHLQSLADTLLAGTLVGVALLEGEMGRSHPNHH